MNFYQFKTNINCGNCLATATPFLDGDNSIENWEVDLEDPDRILSVETVKKPEEIIEIVKNAGYTAELTTP